MPRQRDLIDSDDEDENEQDERTSLLHDGKRRVRRVWGGFIDFAFQGNVLEIAFGLILASNFTSIVNSFVSDIVLPPLAVILPLQKNLEQKFAVLKPGPNYDAADGYNTLKLAQEDGAIVMGYGYFASQCINFLGIGLSLYAIAGTYQYFSSGDPIIKRTVKCKYCKKRISEKARRCVNCSSWQDGREDLPISPPSNTSRSSSAMVKTPTEQPQES